ncbi:hypothetical protein BDV96DRAFT_664083 [Lophiotrema nucula]|uniref:Uncharacterized protein n=1 Tax=Lophiotrema nucula TaxID=690887 RepID=A0A6A5Z0D3_9PLEO|nr:hypothetical protein BDV96DRAFT_664083 [Lophiotrema nucula]
MCLQLKTLALLTLSSAVFHTSALLAEASTTASTWICTPTATNPSSCYAPITQISDGQIQVPTACLPTSSTRSLRILTLTTQVTQDVGTTVVPAQAVRSLQHDACPSGYAPSLPGFASSTSASAPVGSSGTATVTSDGSSTMSWVISTFSIRISTTSSPESTPIKGSSTFLESESGTGMSTRSGSSTSSLSLSNPSGASSVISLIPSGSLTTSPISDTESAVTGSLSIDSSASSGSPTLPTQSASSPPTGTNAPTISAPFQPSITGSTISGLSSGSGLSTLTTDSISMIASSLLTMSDSKTDRSSFPTTRDRLSTSLSDSISSPSLLTSVTARPSDSASSSNFLSSAPSLTSETAIRSSSGTPGGTSFGNPSSSSTPIGMPLSNFTIPTGAITGTPTVSSFTAPPSTAVSTTGGDVFPTQGSSSFVFNTTFLATSSSTPWQPTLGDTTATATNTTAVLWPTPSPTDFDFGKNIKDLDDFFILFWEWIELWKRDHTNHKDEILIRFDDIFDLLGKFKLKLPSPPDIPVPDCMHPPKPKCGPFPLNFICDLAAAVIHLVECMMDNLNKLKDSIIHLEDEGIDDLVLHIKNFMEALKTWDPKTQPPYIDDPPKQPTPSGPSLKTCSPQTTVTETSVSCLVTPVSTNAQLTTQSCTTTTSTKVGCDIVGFATTMTSTATCSPSLAYRTSVSCVAAPDTTNPASTTQSCATVTSKVSGCDITGTATTTITSLPASKTACRRDCPHCRGPSSTGGQASPLASGVLHRDIAKRALRKPANYGGNINTFMQDMCSMPGADRLRHAGPGDEFSTTGATWRLENTMRTFCVSNLWGCTSVVVISRKRVWLSHIYEMPSMWDTWGTDVFTRDVKTPIEQGGGNSNIPVGSGVGSFAGTGGDFDATVQENNVRAFIIGPVVHLMGHYSNDVAHALEHDEIKIILATQLHIPSNTIDVVTYRPLEVDAGIDPWTSLDEARGKILINYDASEPVAPNANGGACPKRPALDFWVEDRATAYYSDAWSAFPNQLVPPSGNQGWNQDSSPTGNQTSAVSGCESTPTFTGIPCAKDCPICGSGPTAPSQSASTVHTPEQHHSLTKRALPKPDDFDGDMTEFMKSLCYGLGHSVRHATQGDPYSTTFGTWSLETTPETFCVEQLWGCTAVVVVSRKRVWMAHLFENPTVRAFPGTDIWRTQIEYPFEHGGAQSNIPPDQSLGAFAQPGGDFDVNDAENNLQVFLMAPTLEYQGESVPSVMANPLTHNAIDELLMRLLHIDLSRITIFPYQRLRVGVAGTTWDTLRNSPYGKIAVAYDPFSSFGPVPGQAPCLRPNLEVWVEAGQDARYFDSWAPYAKQIGVAPQKRFAWNGTELVRRDAPACTIAFSSVPSTLTTTISPSSSNRGTQSFGQTGSWTTSSATNVLSTSKSDSIISSTTGSFKGSSSMSSLTFSSGSSASGFQSPTKTVTVSSSSDSDTSSSTTSSKSAWSSSIGSLTATPVPTSGTQSSSSSSSQPSTSSSSASSSAGTGSLSSSSSQSPTSPSSGSSSTGTAILPSSSSSQSSSSSSSGSSFTNTGILSSSSSSQSSTSSSFSSSEFATRSSFQITISGSAFPITTTSTKSLPSLNPWDTPGHLTPPTASPWTTETTPRKKSSTSSSSAQPISEPLLNPGHGPKSGQPSNNIPPSVPDLTGTSSWVPSPLTGEAVVTG